MKVIRSIRRNPSHPRVETFEREDGVKVLFPMRDAAVGVLCFTLVMLTFVGPQQFGSLQNRYLQRLKDPLDTEAEKIRTNFTIITAYFPTETHRHSADEYTGLMGSLFSNDDAMIIFTSPEFAPILIRIRNKPERTVVISTNLSDTMLVKQYPQEAFWSRISKTGRGPGINKNHDPRLYQIWNSKVNFLKIGSDQNPFHSEFFAWVDVGIARWPQYENTTIIQRVPPELPNNKMALLNVTPILWHKKYHQMGGGIFGGYKEAIDLYNAEYYKILQQYANSSYTLLSNEQILLHDTCTVNPGLCFVITPIKSENNPLTLALSHPYFYMLPFLNDKEYNAMEQSNLVDKSGW